MPIYLGTQKLQCGYFGTKELEKGMFDSVQVCGEDIMDPPPYEKDDDATIKYHFIAEFFDNAPRDVDDILSQYTAGGWTRTSDKKGIAEYKSTDAQGRINFYATDFIKHIWIMKDVTRTDYDFCFENMSKVESIYFDESIPAFTYMNRMFKGCADLKRIYLNEGQFAVATIQQQDMFRNCTSLEFIQYVSTRPTGGRQNIFANTPNLMRPSVDEKAYLSESWGGVFQFDMKRCCEDPQNDLSWMVSRKPNVTRHLVTTGNKQDGHHSTADAWVEMYAYRSSDGKEILALSRNMVYNFAGASQIRNSNTADKARDRNMNTYYESYHWTYGFNFSWTSREACNIDAIRFRSMSGNSRYHCGRAIGCNSLVKENRSSWYGNWDNNENRTTCFNDPT